MVGLDLIGLDVTGFDLSIVAQLAYLTSRTAYIFGREVDAALDH